MFAPRPDQTEYLDFLIAVIVLARYSQRSLHLSDAWPLF